MRHYKTLVIDPPWDYKRDKGWHGYAGDPKYHVTPEYTLMTVSEMREMSATVNSMADPNGCAAFMWTTNAFLADAYDLLDAWGWTRSAVRGVWVWLKSENGMGMGRWCRNDTEFVIHATRGDVTPPERAESNVFRGPVQGHSVKPQSFYDKVERISPGPYLDMFGGRNTLRFGWDVWGDGK